MFAQILPGLREIRGPLAAGFLWLLLSWLLLHESIATEGGNVGELVQLGRQLPPVALTAIASFAAYLLGSLSHDFFGGTIGVIISLIVRRRAEGEHSPGTRRFHLVAPRRSRIVVGGPELSPDAVDRIDAETDLRIAIVPPIVALAVYFAISDGGWWWLGLLVAWVVAVQALHRAWDYAVASGNFGGISGPA